MGYADRSYSYRPDGSSGGSGGRGGFGGLSGSVSPWVLRLLVANGAIFLLMLVGLLPRRWAIEALGFSPGGVLTRPWSLITYMFVHGGFWHVGVNMLVLFFFGPPLERAWGGRDFLKYYLVAGLGAALFSYLFLPLPDVSMQTTVVGASGAIFGLMLAFALMWPDAQIYIWGIFPMRAKWFVGLLAVFTLFSSFRGGGSQVADWAHLGGLVTGFAYLRWGRPVSGALDRVFDALGGLASGTGDLALRAARRMREGTVVAADLTPEMMREGRRRPGAGGVRWTRADALDLPFADGSFDRVLIGYGLRNFSDLSRSLAEIHRCLRPGGRLLSLDFGKPEAGWLRAAYLRYLEASTTAAGWVLHRDPEAYLYIPESLRRYPAQEEICALMNGAGFRPCAWVDLMFGTMAIHVAHRAERRSGD